jgi:hypothetical protein
MTDVREGDRFVRWTVLALNPKVFRRNLTANCKCDCGVVRDVYVCHLKSGQSKSCGCLCLEKITTHGESRGPAGARYTALYATWLNMKRRCDDPSNPQHKNYGARGISVCDEWSKSYQAFRDHVGQRPTPRHSLDRIDNNDGYKPGNIRWATPAEQSANRRVTVKLTIDGKQTSITEAAQAAGVSYATMHRRVKRYGHNKNIAYPSRKGIGLGRCPNHPWMERPAALHEFGEPSSARLPALQSVG